ncbi:MAG: Na(+)-translocating NADH-quinone reductase subunit C [Deltaproteobacteria bacterium]|nr:Na(+)-translocating NADH-quinone reductase subunit C [Deltaproteobacteria bacterium]
MSKNKDSLQNTLLVALAVSLVCSVVVSVAAVFLKPIQEYNKALDRKKNILMAAGLYEEGQSVDAEALYQERIRPRLVDLKSGDYVDQKADLYDQYQVAKDPAIAVHLNEKEDIASIRAIAPLSVVYEVLSDGKLEQVVLPVHGKGLWSTMYGYLAVMADGNTIRGLGFYDQQETPGLGGEVDNPRWKALWHQKKLRDGKGDLKIEVIKGHVNPEAVTADFQVDGLSGATITSRGVSHLVRFWVGDRGFRSYLTKLKH